MKIVKICSDEIHIKSNDEEFANIKLNDLIRVSDDSADLVAMVTILYDTDADVSVGEDDFFCDIDSVKSITCKIIGSIKDDKFVKSIDVYPGTKVDIGLVDTNLFKNMLDGRMSGFELGKYTSYDIGAKVDGNKLFQRHACIVGNTGSGKSETVAKVLQEISKLKKANTIIFDIHGEYKNLSYAKNISLLDFPIWMMPFDDVVNNFLKSGSESSTTIQTALNIAHKKIMNSCGIYCFDDLYAELYAMDNEMIDTGDVYKSGDKKGCSKYVKGDFNGKLTSTVNYLYSMINGSKYSFLFHNQDHQYKNQFLYELYYSEKSVKVIDFSWMDNDVAIMIIGIITKLLYQKQLEMKQYYPISLICDEAHIYIPNNFNLSASEKRMVSIFENIAKEGRKFGFTLFVCSQRPSELNKTIMAQCSNFIVGKLNNENDKSMIKGMIPEGSSELIDATTMFSPGDVIIIGDAVKIPLKIHVELAKERPNSRTIEFWDEWNKEE